jgi:hypothetical protein
MLLSVTGISAAASDMSTSAGSRTSRGGTLITPDLALPPERPESIAADIQFGNEGEVLEVLDSEIYTYLQVTTEKGPLWLAAYKTDIPRGATIRYPTGILVSNFRSNSLKRSFKVIVFVDRVKLVK